MKFIIIIFTLFLFIGCSEKKDVPDVYKSHAIYSKDSSVVTWVVDSPIFHFSTVKATITKIIHDTIYIDTCFGKMQVKKTGTSSIMLRI